MHHLWLYATDFYPKEEEKILSISIIFEFLLTLNKIQKQLACILGSILASDIQISVFQVIFLMI